MQINDILSLELELTSRCNAACPQCPRTNHYFAKDLDHTCRKYCGIKSIDK